MYEKNLSNITLIKQSATNSELVAQLQADVRVWAKQMEKVGYLLATFIFFHAIRVIFRLAGTDAISTVEARERIRRTDRRDRILAKTVGQIHQYRRVY